MSVLGGILLIAAFSLVGISFLMAPGLLHRLPAGAQPIVLSLFRAFIFVLSGSGLYSNLADRGFLPRWVVALWACVGVVGSIAIAWDITRSFSKSRAGKDEHA